MRLPSLRSCIALCVAGLSLSACALDADDAGEDLGDLGDGKSDAFGIVDRQVTIAAGRYKRFTFSADASFKVAITQPTTASGSRPDITLSLKTPDGDRVTADAGPEPTLVVDQLDDGSYSLTVKNVGSTEAALVLNVRPLGGFDGLPNPNAPQFPDVAWQPPAVDAWPASYVIFNNTGCGHDCTQADSSALQPRSVMIKMLVTAIKSVEQGGTVRVSNFNISGSASVKPVTDALVWAITERGATVKIVMDQAQNTPTSRTTAFAMQGAQVRFLDGMHYTTGTGNAAMGIMHSKIVVVDDRVVISGSNNMSSTGMITNEENSVVLTGTTNADRIRSFTCDVDTMFEAGVEPGQPQKTDAERKTSVAKLDACNGPDTWFPPSGVIATGSSITYANVVKAISGAKKSIAIAPDMLAHPGLVEALLSRAKKAKALGQPFAIRLVLDASEEALGNPAFGECLMDGAAADGLDIQVRYWPGTHEIYQLNHHKFMLIDAGETTGAALYNGSANYSAKALKWSFENVTRYAGTPYRPLVDAFAARFDQMFGQAKDSARLAADDGITAPACPL